LTRSTGKLLISNRLPLVLVALGTALALNWRHRYAQGLGGLGDPAVIFVASLFGLNARLEGPADRLGQLCNVGRGHIQVASILPASPQGNSQPPPAVLRRFTPYSHQPLNGLADPRRLERLTFAFGGQFLLFAVVCTALPIIAFRPYFTGFLVADVCLGLLRFVLASYFPAQKSVCDQG